MSTTSLPVSRSLLLFVLFAVGAGVHAAEEVLRTETNDGNLVMDNVPPIPQQVVDDLNRYQNVRSARFLDWAGEGEGTSGGMYIATRFADVDQVHYVAAPGGARRQLTWFIVQGQNDPRVPVSESEQMVTALRQQGQPVWYMNALNEGHGYQRKDNRDVYQQAMVLFFRHYLLDRG